MCAFSNRSVSSFHPYQVLKHSHNSITIPVIVVSIYLAYFIVHLDPYFPSSVSLTKQEEVNLAINLSVYCFQVMLYFTMKFSLLSEAC